MPEEVYTFLATSFDIDKAKAMIEDGNIIREGTVNVHEAAKILSLHKIDEEWVKKMTSEQLEQPVIIATILTKNEAGEDEDVTLLIDGWHRIARAKKDRIDHLEAILIDGDQVKMANE